VIELTFGVVSGSGRGMVCYMEIDILAGEGEVFESFGVLWFARDLPLCRQ